MMGMLLILHRETSVSSRRTLSASKTTKSFPNMVSGVLIQANPIACHSPIGQLVAGPDIPTRVATGLLRMAMRFFVPSLSISADDSLYVKYWETSVGVPFPSSASFFFFNADFQRSFWARSRNDMGRLVTLGPWGYWWRA